MTPDRQYSQMKAQEIHLSVKVYIFTHVVRLSFEHNAGDNMIWLGSTPSLRENTLKVVRGLPPLYPFPQTHEKTVD
ncbi:hypothetical protein TNCV_532921 [Trichonephila clavipes]|nr:hypothetical protein TNCV_532921 [Trichonephila clavipes]